MNDLTQYRAIFILLVTLLLSQINDCHMKRIASENSGSGNGETNKEEFSKISKDNTITQSLISKLVDDCIPDADTKKGISYSYNEKMADKKKVRGSISAESKFRLYTEATKDSLDENSSASYFLYIALCLIDKSNLKNNEVAEYRTLKAGKFNDLCPINTAFAENCHDAIHQKYRHVSSLCNNINISRMGAASSTFSRMLPHLYADDFNSPRIDNSLPGSREISLGIFEKFKFDELNEKMKKINTNLMFMAMMIDHDTSQFVGTKTYCQEEIECCNEDKSLNHPSCFSIYLSNKDIHYSKMNKTCISLIRSAASVHSDCSLGPREQLNQATSYLDLSNLYGSTVFQSEILKDSHGLLKTIDNFFPLSTKMDCHGGPCRLSGDERVNIHPGLLNFQNLFLLKHISLAKKFKLEHPNWSHNKLYEEARRRLIAIWQNIIYSEFLPIVIGNNMMEKYKLNLPSSLEAEYDPKTNARTLNEFASSASKFWMALPVEYLSVVKNSGKKSYKPIFKSFYSHFPSYPKEPTELHQGSLSQQIFSDVNVEFPKKMLYLWMRNNSEDVGLDIVSIIIQQGRDHGIRSYSDYLGHCENKKIKEFKDLSDYISSQSIDKLKTIYKKVQDIDLFVGGILEKPLKDGIVGPTFGCIMAQQFYNLRHGDRYFFTNKIPGNFKEDEYKTIRKTTLRNVFCDALKLDSVPMEALYIANKLQNKALKC